MALRRASWGNVGRGNVLLTRQVPSLLLSNPPQPSLWCAHHDHAGQLDLRLVGWDQGDGDTGSDRDGGAGGLDGTVRWCHNTQLQLQRGVNHRRALLWSREGGSIPDLFPGEPRRWGTQGLPSESPKDKYEKGVASQPCRIVYSLCLCSHRCLLGMSPPLSAFSSQYS